MDIDSPLRFLDRDVSRCIYETYFPSEKNRIAYNQVIYNLNEYIKQSVHSEFCSRFSLRDTSAWIKRTGPDTTCKHDGVIWLWYHISATGSPIDTNTFHIQDNGDGTGVFQENGFQWGAISFPPQAGHYFTGEKFLSFLKDRHNPRVGRRHHGHHNNIRYAEDALQIEESRTQRRIIKNQETTEQRRIIKNQETIEQYRRNREMNIQNMTHKWIRITRRLVNAYHMKIKKRWRRFARNLWKLTYLRKI